MDSSTKYELFKEHIKRVAKFVAHDFPDVEPEDIEGDLVLFVLDNKKMTDPNAEWLSTALIKRAKSIAWNYRKQGLYITSQYAYRHSDVRKMLDAAFDHNDWDVMPIPDDARSMMDGDRLAIASDIKLAYKKLPRVLQIHLYRRYVLRMMPETEAEKQKINRAVDRLVDVLNFYKGAPHEGPGARKVINNASATARIQDQTD